MAERDNDASSVEVAYRVPPTSSPVFIARMCPKRRAPTTVQKHGSLCLRWYPGAYHLCPYFRHGARWHFCSRGPQLLFRPSVLVLDGRVEHLVETSIYCRFRHRSDHRYAGIRPKYKTPLKHEVYTTLTKHQFLHAQYVCSLQH